VEAEAMEIVQEAMCKQLPNKITNSIIIHLYKSGNDLKQKREI